MIPSTDVGECHFDADIGLDELRHLLQPPAEFAGVLRPIGGRVRMPPYPLERPQGLEVLVLGGAARGQTVYGPWPGLEAEQLYEGRDLAVTTDFRDVLGEIVAAHLEQQTAHVFPGHALAPPLGFLRATPTRDASAARLRPPALATVSS